MEAFEHERQLLLREFPRHGRQRRPRPRETDHLERAVARIELAGVVEQARDRPLHGRPLSDHRRRHGDDHDLAAGAALVASGDVVATSARSSAWLGSSVSSPEATATISLTSSVNSSVSACRSATIAARSAASSSGCRRSVSTLVRRLVSGVRSSCPASCTSRCWSSRERAKRCQHAVEGGAQPPDLVVAIGADRRVESAGRLDVLSGLREPAQRGRDTARDPPARPPSPPLQRSTPATTCAPSSCADTRSVSSSVRAT